MRNKKRSKGERERGGKTLFVFVCEVMWMRERKRGNALIILTILNKV